MRRAQNPMRRSWLDDTDGGWLPHRLPLMVAPAWRLRPVPLIHLLERIEIEHLRHGGRENGRLIVSFDQFVAHGVSRKFVRPAIELGESLGLLSVRQSTDWDRAIRAPNEYRLTYVPEKDRRAPTDEWAGLSESDVGDRVTAFKALAIAKAKATSQFPFRQRTSSHFDQENAATSSHSDQPPVPIGEPSIISAGSAPPPEAQRGGEASPHKAGERDAAAQASDMLPISEALARTKILAAATRGSS